MKFVNLFCLLVFMVSCVSAQNNQNTANTQNRPTNQWIDFDKTYYKIKVAENGIYRVDYQNLIEQGFPTDFTDAKRLSLINEGKEIPIYVSDTVNWGEGAYLEFYGQRVDGKFDQRLFENPEDQLHPYWSQFTDTAVYFLSYAEPNSKIVDFENSLNNLPEKETHFMHTEVLHFQNFHSNGKPNTQIHYLRLESFPEESRPLNSYFANYSAGEGWVGNLFASDNPIADNFVKTSIQTPAIYYNGDMAQLTMKIVGLSSDTSDRFNHLLEVNLNDQLIVQDQYKGYTTQKYTIDLPLGRLSAPETYIESKALHPELIDRQAISYIEVKYPRAYNFDGVDHLSFTINHKEAGNYLEFENLKADETYFLYDIPHLIKTKLTYHSEKEVHQVYLPAHNGEQRQLILQNENQIQKVSRIGTTNFIDYSNPINQGDYIIITHPTLNKKDGAVSNYAKYRSSAEGGAFQTITVDVENLYDQYSYGIRKHPLAIKYFINEAIENWVNTPSHCLLLGKGIKNSKCRYRDNSWNNLTIDWTKNLVPTFGDSPNDQYFGAADFSPLSRIAIGRLSVDNQQDIQNYLNKVIAVEKEYYVEDCNYIEAEKWKHEIFHIGGGSSVEQQNRFNERLVEQANIAKSGMLTANTHFLLESGASDDIEGCASEDDSGSPIPPQTCITNFFEQGKRIVNFLGHASGLFWQVDIGKPEDYTYNQKYPIMIAQCNFVGDTYRYYADEDTYTMPEEWLNAKDAGATAYIGFDAIFEMHYAANLVDALYEQMFKINPELTLGEQVNAAILSYYNANDSISQHACDKMIFSGDPALKYTTQTKPEIKITEDHVSFTVEQINDFYYDVELNFDFSSVNLAATESVPYAIVLTTGNTETVVEENLLRVGERGYFKKEFTLLPDEEHTFRIHLDPANQLDEICEYNNTFNLNTGFWMIDIENSLLSNNQIKASPNPFSSETIFHISLSQTLISQNHYLSISNLSGQKVHLIKLAKGIAEQSVNWHGQDAKGNRLAAGVYWYQLKNADSQIVSLPQKIVLIR